MSGSSSFAMMLEPWASIMTHAGTLDKTVKEAHEIPDMRSSSKWIERGLINKHCMNFTSSDHKKSTPGNKLRCLNPKP